MVSIVTSKRREIQARAPRWPFSIDWTSSQSRDLLWAPFAMPGPMLQDLAGRRNLSRTNTPDIAPTPEGLVARFNANGNFAGDSPFSNWNVTTSFTFITWVRPTGTSFGVTAWYGAGGRVLLRQNTLKWEFRTRNGALAWQVAESGDVITTGTKMHVACVHDPAALLQTLYLDAAVGDTAVASGTLASGAGTQNLGADPNGTSRVWSGDMWGVRFYDRALSADEIAETYRNPWGHVEEYGKRLIFIPAAGGGGGVSGSFSWTEAADTYSGSGAVAVVGSLSATEAADTSSFAGAVSISGTLGYTEALDTSSITGAVAISGSLSYTEAVDTSYILGSTSSTPTRVGTLAWTEAADTASLSGTTLVAGTLAYTEAADTASLAGTVAIQGTLGATEAADTSNLVGSVLISGEFSWTEEADTFLSVPGGPSGSFSFTELADTALILGTSPHPTRAAVVTRRKFGVRKTRTYH